MLQRVLQSFSEHAGMLPPARHRGAGLTPSSCTPIASKSFYTCCGKQRSCPMVVVNPGGGVGWAGGWTSNAMSALIPNGSFKLLNISLLILVLWDTPL